eukprot:PLAT3940.2.p1 GENE.PLAT3940.2~~PLAT3940.2.p1  ORF type:complete len:146 (-),score=57.83 PLAT3940.2:193-630(-)
MFSAVTGRGAFLNGERLAVAAESRVEAALVGFGIGTSRLQVASNMRGVSALAARCRGMRNFGSAALHLAYVAAGRLTAFYELDLNAWDLCAGAVLIAEAGGRVTDTDGSDYCLTTRSVMSSNAVLHDELLSIVTEAGGCVVGDVA